MPDNSMVFKIRWQPEGSHVHCILYVAHASDLVDHLCGTFTLKDLEFESFRQAFQAEFKELPAPSPERKKGPRRSALVSTDGARDWRLF